MAKKKSRGVKLMKTIAEIYRDVRKQWRFRLKAKNGEIIAVSEAYSRKSSVERGAKRAYPQSELRYAK